MSGAILLVEDDASAEKLTVRALAQCGFETQVVVARDGAAALDYLFATGEHAGRSTSALPSLVLLDLKLPKIDGIEVLRRVRADERTRHVPLVVLTSSNEEEDVLRCYELGANAYVRKPMGFTEFVEATRVLVHFWLLLNERAPGVGAPS